MSGDCEYRVTESFHNLPAILFAPNDLRLSGEGGEAGRVRYRPAPAANHRAAASALSSGRVLKAIAAPGAAL